MGAEASAKVANPDKYVSDLVNYVGRNRVTMEVCLTSNEQTMPWLQGGKLADHTFAQMLDQGVQATLCTDNRLMSRTSTVQVRPACARVWGARVPCACRCCVSARVCCRHTATLYPERVLVSRTSRLTLPCLRPSRCCWCVRACARLHQELRKAVDTFQMTPAQVRRVVLAGFQAAFYPGDFRAHQAYVRKAEAMYAAVEARHGVQA